MAKGDGGIIDRVVSLSVELIFSEKRNIERWLILLMIVGFILRLIAAFNLGVFADDMVYASQSAGIINSHIISTHSNPPLFFYLTDFAYKIFGYTTFASRLWPLLAGTMLILLVFLITSKFFGKKVGLLSAFFVTFSNFLVRMTFTEASLLALFFCLFGVYLGLLYLDNKKVSLLIMAGIAFGLALMTKYNAPFFIMSFLLFAIYYKLKNKETIFSKNNVKHIVIFFAILVLLAMPFITFNYLIYKEKGIVDVYFSRIIHNAKTQQFYGGLAGQENGFIQNIFTLSNYGNYNLIYHTDILLLIFSIIGIVLLFMRKNRDVLIFLAMFLFIPFVLQSAGAPLPKHFVFIPFLLAIPAGYGFSYILDKFKGRYLKIGIISLLALFMIINLGTDYSTPTSYLHADGTSALKSYIDSNVGSSDLVVLDSRIYTARSFWLATDHNFLTLNSFVDFYNYDKNITAPKALTNVYFVECAIDDCGWGTVAQNKDLNDSSEQILNSIKSYSTSVDIDSYSYSGNEIIGSKQKMVEYKVHLMKIPLDSRLVEQTKQINSFYFVPYLYLNMQNYPFNYNAYGFDALLDMLSLFLVYVAMILTILSMIAIILFL